jgi:hypothetical protein
VSKAISIPILISLFSSSSFAQPAFSNSYPDTLNKKRLYTTIGIESGSYIAGLSFLSFVWYKDQERVNFHYYDDSKGYLQMDKAGHAFGAYRYTYSAYHALRWVGLDKKRALIYGGPIGLIFQTPIEIFDGMYEGWGFSWSDMAANTFGSALFVAQEALFDEQVVLMKFSYSPSIYPQYYDGLGETEIERFFLDYNGHTYWLSAGLQRITGIEKIPEWLSISFGYSANGMIREFDNPTFYRGEPFPYFERYRQYLFSLDVNFTKIRTDRRLLKKAFRALNLIKVPFPALEYNSKDGFRMRGLYF